MPSADYQTVKRSAANDLARSAFTDNRTPPQTDGEPMKAETKNTLKALRRFLLEDIAGHEDFTCRYLDGKPDTASMDPLAKPHWRKLHRLLKRVDMALSRG